MSNVLKTFGQSSVVGASCVASGSCASGHNGCCAQASTSFSQTGAGLRYTGPSEVAQCDLKPNLLLRPELSLVEHVDLEQQQAEQRVALALALAVDGEEEEKIEVAERAITLHGVLIDLTSPLERRGGGFILYGEAIGDALLDRGFVFHHMWSPETVTAFVQDNALIRASECYEVRVLKDVFISLWLLDEDGGVCDMIRNFILPMFVARQEVEFRKKAVLYNEFRRAQLAYEAEWSQYYAAHGPEVDGYGDDGYEDNDGNDAYNDGNDAYNDRYPNFNPNLEEEDGYGDFQGWGSN